MRTARGGRGSLPGSIGAVRPPRLHAAAAAVAVAAAVAACSDDGGSSTTATTGPGPRPTSTASADGLRLGVQDDRLLWPQEDVAQRLDKVKQTGATVVRVDLHWDAVATARPADATDPGDPAYTLSLIHISEPTRPY